MPRAKKITPVLREPYVLPFGVGKAELIVYEVGNRYRVAIKAPRAGLMQLDAPSGETAIEALENARRWLTSTPGRSA